MHTLVKNEGRASVSNKVSCSIVSSSYNDIIILVNINTVIVWITIVNKFFCQASCQADL